MPSKTANKPSSSTSLPFIDKLIIGSFAIFFVIAIFVDYINAVAAIGGVKDAKEAATWLWPPKFVWELYWIWIKIDPLLHANPAWCWFVSFWSPFFYAPFYLIAIYCIYNRIETIRIPLIIYASLLFETLSIYFIEAVWGHLPSPNLFYFSCGYGYYLIFPFILIYRFWWDKPFTNGKFKAE